MSNHNAIYAQLYAAALSDHLDDGFDYENWSADETEHQPIFDDQLSYLDYEPMPGRSGIEDDYMKEADLYDLSKEPF